MRIENVPADYVRQLASRVRATLVATVLAASAMPGSPATAATLEIYFIDVEGGQSTLVVTPAGETLLIDAGFPGAGSFSAKAGDAHEARDARRVALAAADAGVARVDYLLVTHFHADHAGGVPELAQLLPIGVFVDHDTVAAGAEGNVPGTRGVFEAYAAVRVRGSHLVPRPGDRLPLRGVEAVVVSSAGATISKPLVAERVPDARCGTEGLAAQDPNENPRSTGIVLRYGKFRFLDVGDLSGAPLFALACPRNRVGAVDVYLVAHHGGGDAAEPATFAAFAPRVAILNNGARKGGAPATFAALHRAPAIEDVWQLHRSENEGAENFAAENIANLDEATAHWIKLSANDDGSFSIHNARTGETRSYAAR
jgi:competence protein ComEC